VAAIVRANGLRNANQIYVGQKLKIPKTGGSTGESSGKCRYRHNVKAGEWVWQIARDYDVSPYKILSANGMTIKSANNIQPGTVLCIP
jgi:LysM repeat protein